jgi:hypothetical protein
MKQIPCCQLSCESGEVKLMNLDPFYIGMELKIKLNSFHNKDVVCWEIKTIKEF